MTILTTELAQELIQQVMPGCVQSLDIRVDSIGQEQAVLIMPANDASCREGGIFSGQAIASLADTAMCFALWSGERGRQPVSTVDLHLTYMRAIAKEDLMAKAFVVRSGRTLSFAKVEILGATSAKIAATAIGTFAWST